MVFPLVLSISVGCLAAAGLLLLEGTTKTALAVLQAMDKTQVAVAMLVGVQAGALAV